MGLWTEHAVPRLVDLSLSTSEVGELRAEVCAGLHGRVLELGFGSGLNLPWLPPEVSSLDAVDPSDVAWGRSAERRAGSSVPVSRLGLDGQSLDAPDASYDAVLATFTLCTVPDPGAALAEVRRVLRPGGAFHFLEHGLAPDAGVVRWQQRLEPVQRRVAGGCHLTRDVPYLVAAAGLEPVGVRAAYLPGPRVGRPWTWVTLGRALRTGR